MIEYIPVTMILEKLEGFPPFPALPEYDIRTFQPGQKEDWACLQSTTDSFKNSDEARIHFDHEFGPHYADMSDRCFFLFDQNNTCIGTAMAWFASDPFAKDYGRLHWVAIHPDWRGRGLGKYLINHTVRQMSRWHEKVYLTTQTTSFVAIAIYLDLGFKPLVSSKMDRKAWELLSGILDNRRLPDSDIVS
ncbi:MAG: GNAT family N-acetyltransferase [Saprospiraceae bacterium]|nr:GNAT family N-acetyltransferase [Saprospiraceae bacterium]